MSEFVFLNKTLIVLQNFIHFTSKKLLAQTNFMFF